MADCNALDVCRLCLASAERLGELTIQLIDIISTCFSLKVNISSELTNKICQECVDQLENVYSYREKIIKNEILLLERSSKIITKHSAMFQSKYDVNKGDEETGTINFNELDVIDIANDESNPDNSDMVLHEEMRSENEKQKEDSIQENEQDCTEPNAKEPCLSSNIDSMWQDIQIANRQLNNLKTDETDTKVDLNDILRDHNNIKSNNIDKSKGIDIEDLIVNKPSLKVHEKPSLIHPFALKSVNQDITLDMDRENTDINNFISKDLTGKANGSIIHAELDIIPNQEQFYAINTDKKFMCLTCFKVFESQKELSIHYKTVELSKSVTESARKYKDVIIDKVFKNDGSKNVFKCDVCSKVFENRALVIKHIQIHKVERPFICNLCSRTYKTVADILRHGVVHNGFNFVCSYECGYTTVHLGALREHVKRHKREFKYRCEKCGKCFQVKTWYDQHQNVHDKVRPFVCKLCGQSFSMARYLTAHQANVHPQSSKVKRYKCVQCALPCDSRKTLVTHMKEKHGMKTDCLCDVCGQLLPDQQKLVLHRSAHEASKKFSCRFCKKTFNKKDHKTVHEKIHTGERLNCNSCTKSFTQRCSLRRHIKRYHQDAQQTLEQKT